MRLVATALMVLAAFCSPAHARPQHKTMFQRRFETRRAEVKATCAVCHPARSKKMRNAFGMALREELGRKNVKEPDVILAALDKAALATDPNSKRPFIELIKQDWRQLNGKDLEREKTEADEATRLTE